MDTTLAIGLIGMACILFAFMMNVFKRFDSNDRGFLFLNLFGSALLLWYAALLKSPPFLILNAVWAVVALWGLLHHDPRMRKAR